MRTRRRPYTARSSSRGQAADDDELVAAEAGGDVHLAGVVGQDAGDEPDRLVAGRVPEPVVDLP